MKHERRPYNHVIEGKLQPLPGMDADHLWDGMHGILDKKMPQRRERRRFIAWFLNDRGLFTIGIALLLTATGICLYFLSPNKISAIDNSSTKKFSHSLQDDQSSENNKVVPSETNTENVAVNSNQTMNQQMTERLSFVVNDRRSYVNASQQTRMPVDITTNDQNILSVQQGSVVDADRQMEKVNLQSENGVDSMYQGETYITSEDFKPVSQDATINEQKKGLAVAGQTQPANNSAQQNIRHHNEKGLYAGIVSGMDLSSVHFQSLKTGASQGLIVGYAFNNKWSVESGLLWDKKRFYDDGTYFDPPGYRPTTTVQIVSVNGTNRIYEWPLNVRYTIIPAKHSLFVTGGLSSYFMKSEHYDYEYTLNNQPGGHNYINYSNASKNWFSVFNFSVGYAHKLGSVGTLRVEPYFKVPLKNLGMANMPITSMGLNIGFTKSLTR